MKVSFEEIGHVSATFAADSGEAGQVCKVIASGKVEPCGEGDVFCGVMEGIRNGHTAVQLHGFVEVGYTGSTPEIGYVNLTADGNGGVKVSNSGRAHLVVGVDTAAMTAIIEL